MPLNSIASQLGPVTSVTQKPAKIRKSRRLLLAMLRSCFPAVGIYLAALPAAQAQYGIFTNPITGTNPNTSDPYTTGQIVAANLTASGIGRGPGIVGVNTNDAYNADNWSTGALDVDDYFTWTMTPGTGYALDLSNFAYTSQISSGTGQVSFRSSLDSFAANIGTPTVSTSNANNVIVLPSAYRDLSSAVTFRLYAHNLAAATTTFRVSDFAYNGLVSTRWNGSADSDLSNVANYVNSNPVIAGNGILFEGSANTAVNVSAPTTIAGIRFAARASPFTLSGNTITLGSGGGIANYSTNLQTINSNLVIPGGTVTTNFNTADGDITLGGVLSSSASSAVITKTGTGTLIVGNANAVAGLTGGTTNLAAGLTKIVGPGTTAVPFGSSAITLGAAATFDLNGFAVTMTTASNSWRGTLTNTSATAASYGSSITNNGTFTVDGTGNIQLAAVTGGVGNNIIKNGTNTLTMTGGINNGNLTMTINNGTVVLAKTSTATAQGLGGPVVINSNGTLRLGGTGGDQIFNGAAATVSVLGGTFDVATFNETLTGTLQIGNGTLNGTVTGTTGTLTNQSTVSAQSGSASAILGGTAGLNKTTSGSFTLSGANTYLGATTVSQGTLVVANNKALGYSGTAGLGVTSAGTSVTAGAVLDVSGLSSVQETITLNGTGAGAGALINSSGTPTVIGGGVATLTLLTAGGNYGTTAPTATVTGGGGTGATATVTRGVTANSFSINGGTTVYTTAPTVAITSGNGTGATATAILSGGTSGVVTGITITNPGTGFSATPNIAFSGGVIGTAGTNPTGTGNNTNFQISGITLNDGGTGFNSAPTVTISGANPATATAALTQVILGSTSSIGGTGDITINSVVSEASAGLGLTKVGTNTLTLGADNNSYTGPTTVNAGTLKLTTSSTNNIATSSQIVLGGGTLDVTSVTGFALANNQVLSGAGTVSGSLIAGATTEVRPGGTGIAGTLNFGPLTLSGAGLTFDLGTTSDLIDLGLSNLLTATGTNTFTLNSLTGFGVGNYTLIDYGTLDGGTSLSNFALSSPTLAGFNVALNDTGSAIVLNVTGGPSGPPTWQGANNDPWTAAGSWTGTVPNSSTAEAKFVTTGGTTANLDANQTVNKLTFDATAPHTISGGSTLTLAGTTPTISTAGSNTGTQTIAVNLDLAAGTSVSVQGGTLELNSPADATLGAGVTATVATGATLSLGGAGNALSNGTTTHANVANSGTLTATTVGKRVGEISGSGTTTVTTAGATLTANHIRQSTLNIGAGNTVTVATNGGNSGTSTLTNLNINATGKLDLANNDLIVDNGNLATLTAKLATGLDINGTYGNGPGITSSAFASNPNFNTVLGIAANVELGYTSFSGQTVDANDILIKYTYYGDADLSGSVDTSTDFDLYITGLTSGGSLGGWLYGDFDYSGTVDSSTDFDLYITGLTTQGGALLTAGGGGNLVQAVPEPSTFVLAGVGLLGCAGLLLRRRRLARCV